MRNETRYPNGKNEPLAPLAFVILLYKDHKKMDELIEDYMDCQAKQPQNDQPSPSLVIPNFREGSIFSPAQPSALSTQPSALSTQNYLSIPSFC